MMKNPESHDPGNTTKPENQQAFDQDAPDKLRVGAQFASERASHAIEGLGI